MSLMKSFNSMMGTYRSRTCPDCKCEMSGGECEECGYGQSESESEDSSEESGVDMQSMLDLRDALQTAMKIVDRIIVQQSSDSD